MSRNQMIAASLAVGMMAAAGWSQQVAPEAGLSW